MKPPGLFEAPYGALQITIMDDCYFLAACCVLFFYLLSILGSSLTNHGDKGGHIWRTGFSPMLHLHKTQFYHVPTGQSWLANNGISFGNIVLYYVLPGLYFRLHHHFDSHFHSPGSGYEGVFSRIPRSSDTKIPTVTNRSTVVLTPLFNSDKFLAYPKLIWLITHLVSTVLDQNVVFIHHWEEVRLHQMSHLLMTKNLSHFAMIPS